jgi:L-iditol 2-dehydrogenase
MKAAVMYETGKIRIEKKPLPVPGNDEVLVKMKYVGLCGSDLHYFEWGRIGPYIVTKPIILGHECSGEVVGKGGNVKNIRIGDIVAVEPGIPCGKCEYCKTGMYNLCPDVVFMATPPIDGALAEYVTYPEDMVFKLPETMNPIEGALLEPLAVGLHAVIQSGVRIGKCAAILGSGCIGLVTMLSLKAIGVTEVYMTDIIPKRLEKALQLGAVSVFKADECNIVDEILSKTDNKGVDAVFEAAGNSVTMQQTVDLVKIGGTILFIGMSPEAKVPYEINKLISKEAEIKTIFRYRNIYPIAIKAVSEGIIPIKDIVTDIFPFDEVEKAFLYNINNKKDVVKAVIEF